MSKKREKINKKLMELGRPLGLNEADALKVKRTARNIVGIAIIAVIVALAGNFLLPGASAGAYYAPPDSNIRELQMIFKGLI